MRHPVPERDQLTVIDGCRELRERLQDQRAPGSSRAESGGAHIDPVDGGDAP